MIIFYFTAKSLSEYLELMRQGKTCKNERPQKCRCENTDCFWAHGSYRRQVEAFAESAEIEIQRFKCRFCGKTVSIFPCFVVPGRRYAMEVIAGGIEGYATVATTYRNEVMKLGMGPSPAQLFQWVAFFLDKVQQLIFDVQGLCISDAIPEAELEQAETAQCPNSWKAQLPGKGEKLHGLAKLIAFCKVLFRGNDLITVLKKLGMQFLADINEMQQIFTNEVVFMSTPQRIKP